MLSRRIGAPYVGTYVRACPAGQLYEELASGARTCSTIEKRAAVYVRERENERERERET